MLVLGSDPGSDSEPNERAATAATTTAAAAAYGVVWWCMIDEVLMVMAPGVGPDDPACSPLTLVLRRPVRIRKIPDPRHGLAGESEAGAGRRRPQGGPLRQAEGAADQVRRRRRRTCAVVSQPRMNSR